MQIGAVLCTNCGFDTRTSKRITTAKAKAPIFDPELAAKYANKNKKKDKLAPQGSFWVGLAVSAGFAAVGSILWVLIAWMTHREWALVAMGVGALAGVGMQIGQKGYSTLGGAVAAALTFVAIIIANIAYWILVVAVALHAHKPSAKAVDIQTQLKQY